MMNHHEWRGMPSRGTILAILVAGIVLLSGCAGWGTDGPVDQDDTEPAQADDLENESNATEAGADGDSSDSDASASDGDGGASDGDDSTAEDGSSDGDSGATDGDSGAGDSDDGNESDSDDTDAGDGNGGDVGNSNSSDSIDGGAGADGSADSSGGDDSSNDSSDGNESSDGDNRNGATDGDSGDDTVDDGGTADGTDDSNESETHSLTVTVVKDGKSVAGVSVNAYGPTLDNGAPHETSGETDANGQVVLEVHEGTYTVETNFGSSEASTEVDVSGDSEVTLDATTETDPTETHTLTVTITDPNGDPVEGLPVVLVTYEEKKEVARTTTDADGKAKFDVKAGSYEIVEIVEDSEYTSYGTHPVDVRSDTEYSIQVSKPPNAGDGDGGDAGNETNGADDGASDGDDGTNGGDGDGDSDAGDGDDGDDATEPETNTLTVTITDPSGEPVEGLPVELAPHGDDEKIASTTTNADGEAQFDVRVGEKTVTGVAIDNTDREPKTIQIGPQEPVTVGNLTIAAVR